MYDKYYQANEAGRRGGEGLEYYLYEEVREGLCEEVIFEQRP